MANFPSVIDTFINPSGTSLLAVVDHSLQHVNINNAMGAVETKVGIDNSSDVNSLDYKVKHIDVSGSLNIYNVKSYGAKGDGTTDDSLAIGSAITAIGTSDGNMYFPPGNYLVSQSNSITNQMSVSGAGRNSSIITTNNGTANIFVVSTDNPIKFCDLGFNSSVTRTGGAAIQLNGAGTATTNNFSSISRCQILNQYIGIDIVAASLFYIEDNYIAESYKYGIRMRNTVNPDSGDASIIGNTIDSSRAATYGVYHLSGGGLRFINNKINRHQVGYYVDIENGAPSSLLFIEGNSIEGQSAQSMIFGRSSGTGTLSGITIVGNEINSSLGNTSLYVTDGGYTNFVINDNYVVGNTGTAAAIGFNLNAISGAIAQGNMFVNFNTGIILGTGATNVYYGPNAYFGCSTAVTNSGGASNGAYTTKMAA